MEKILGFPVAALAAALLATAWPAAAGLNPTSP